MTVIKKLNGKLNSFKRDESGAFSMIYAVCTVVLFAGMGAAMDYSILTSAKSRAQSVADTTALSAAIYVKHNGIIPTNRETGLIGYYTAEELGYNFRDWVIDGGQGVTINVGYDEINKEAIVTATGKTRPMLMQIFGHTELDFNSRTVVKFEEKEPLDPASIVLVMDNSGSMAWDDSIAQTNGSRPNPHQSRISGLESAAINFMTKLTDIVGPQDENGPTPAVLRTGLLAFATDTTITRAMDWGVLAEGEITAMGASGWTNSAPPLKTAKEWLTFDQNEPKKHLDETGKDPLKYVILMTDGKNTVGEEEWVERAGTENWRRYVTGRDSPAGLTGEEPGSDPTPTNTLVSYGSCSGGTWQAKCYRIKNDGELKTEFRHYEGPFNYDPGVYQNDFVNNKGKTRTAQCYSEVLEEETCTDDVYETKWSGYEYDLGQNAPDGDPGWEEGEFDIESNIKSREECDELHNNDVEVFTVAFALEPGIYYRNTYNTTTTSVEDSNKARAILQYCASSEDKFITANNTAALEAAFERIGDAIVKEIIRIDS